MHRIPANCAYTPLKHTSSGIPAPMQVTETSPRPYGLLNSGLVVLRPDKAVEADLVNIVRTSPLIQTFRFPDQDLLAEYFRGRWLPLKWCYNALKTLSAIHRDLWRDEEIRCLHYILPEKPWHRRAEAGDEYEKFTRWWWDQFDSLAEDLEKSDKESGRFDRAMVFKSMQNLAQ
jgi:lipopolysaccharide biosynthesis glycosyltransferase